MEKTERGVAGDVTRGLKLINTLFAQCRFGSLVIHRT